MISSGVLYPFPHRAYYFITKRETSPYPLYTMEYLKYLPRERCRREAFSGHT